LYPNPAGDFIQVQSSQNMGNVVVQNALGQALIEINADGQQRVQISLNGVAPGMYWVRVQGAGVRAFVVMR
jgi:Secretion system C-terminal sorting domain